MVSQAQKAIDIAFTDLIDKYGRQILSKTKLRQDEAERISWEFQTECRTKEEKLADELNEMIRKEVYKKGSAILDEYHSYIWQIEEDMKIAGFDFRKVKDLKKCEFESIRDVVDKVTDTENLYEDKPNRVKNPKYRKFLFIHWGGPEYIIQWEKVKTGVINYVDKEKFGTSLTGIKVEVARNVDEMLKEASLLVKEFKLFFAREMNRFDDTIKAVTDELNSNEKLESIMNKSKAEHEMSKNELENYLNKLNAVTDF